MPRTKIIFVLFVYMFLFSISSKGCNRPDYGSNCDIPCPVNCKERKCHIQLETCIGCEPGCTGTYCDISM